MAKTQTPETSNRGKQLAATVPVEYWQAFDAHHWDARKALPAIVREALDDYAAKHGIDTSGEQPTD